ncbi:MAG: DUF4268 domain-containing protein [Chloroflexi bacterium]|nr:DUF4268 domain-containing protein [Chloroflexota bacterium]
MTDQNKLAKIVIVPLREVFPREAEDFTRWLGSDEGLELLCDSTGMSLRFVAREIPVGPFAADLLVSSGDDDTVLADVVIENQYGETDHDHLGKVITYAAGLDTKKIIWIAERFRQEHRSALAWLNEHSKDDIDFLGVQVRTVKIGSSDPAVEFNVVVEPDGWRRRATGAATNPRGEMYRAYWEKLIPQLQSAGHIQRRRTATPYSWISVPSSVAGAVYGLNFRQGKRVGVDLYLDSTSSWNSAVFQILESQKEEIQTSFGSSLNWEQLDGKKACRIAHYGNGVIDAEEPRLGEIRTWMIDSLIRLKTATEEPLIAAATKLSDSDLES